MVYKCTRNKHRNIQATELQVLPDSIQRSLTIIQGIENCLHHQDVRSSIHETNNLLELRLHKLIKRDVASGWVRLNGRRDGSGAVRRTDSSNDKTGRFVSNLSSKSSRFVAQLINVRLHLGVSAAMAIVVDEKVFVPIKFDPPTSRYSL
jgi:hypothetical protein